MLMKQANSKYNLPRKEQIDEPIQRTTLMKPWPFKKLEQHVKEQGYSIQRTKNNEWKVDDKNGHPIAFFASTHGKGSNREVLAPYIKKILQAIEKDKNDEAKSEEL
jgi:hypothetical protein